MSNRSTAAMEEGVRHSSNFLLFLSGDPELGAAGASPTKTEEGGPSNPEQGQPQPEQAPFLSSDPSVLGHQPQPNHKRRRICAIMGAVNVLVAITFFIGLWLTHLNTTVAVSPNASWSFSYGTQPTDGVCNAREYLASEHDGLCHSCNDCTPGQECSRTGCYDCSAGQFDPDHDVLTPCADCPEGLTSGTEASTTCTKDVWGILELLFGVLGGLGFAPLSLECYQMVCASRNTNEQQNEDVEALPVTRTRQEPGRRGQPYSQLASNV
jgi:hypothetical protein